MRRSDREVTDEALIRQVIDDCQICRVGINDEEEVYIIPMNFGYSLDSGAYSFYFHGAKAGRKYALAAAIPDVGFEMDTDYKLYGKDAACSYTARFRSIIGTGELSIVEDGAEKLFGLERIMEHCTGRGGWSFEEKMVDKTAVFKLRVKSLSCKEHE